MSAVLRVRNLNVGFTQDGKTTLAVKGVSFEVARGETVALVGESGSGKSVTALSTVSLLPDSAQISGSITYDGAEMVGASEKELRRVRGNDISFIFQEPMTSLNPLHGIERQISESLIQHQNFNRLGWRARTLRGFVENKRRLAPVFLAIAMAIYSLTLPVPAFLWLDIPAAFEGSDVGAESYRFLLRLASLGAFALAGYVLGLIWLLIRGVLQRGLYGALGQVYARDPLRERVLELLRKVGIRDPETRLNAYPHELSGGQRQRVMIAMALANGPDLLIADEPTTALDVTIQAQILDLLADLKRDEGMSLLFITHDLGIVRRIADRVCVMKDGEIVETGPTARIFDAPQHPYTKKLLAAESTGRPDPVPADAAEIARTDDLRIWFPIKRGFLRKVVGHVKAVNAASLSVREGETIGIVGESGSGKTTLALAIMRLISSQGPVVFLGKDIQGWKSTDLRPLRRDMQIVFQDPYGSLSPRMTIAEIVSEGLKIHKLGDGRNKDEMVAEILTEVGLDPSAMGRYPHEFSGGQRQRIAIARAMILRPRLLVLDEPTSALDMTVQVQIVELLRNLQRKYKLAYLFISHDLKVVRAMSHRVMVMKNGDVIEQGTADEIFEAPKTEYTRSLIAAALGPKARETA